MAVAKRLIIVLAVVAAPFLLILLFSYDVIKIDWISFMEIQPSYRPMEDPLLLPERSIPIQGAAYIPELGAPANPSSADQASLDRGKAYFETSCMLCHGAAGKGDGNFAAFLTKIPPANLVAEDAAARNLSDGAIFLTITNGIEGSMPSLKANLPTAEMRWDMVNYLRYLQDQPQ